MLFPLILVKFVLIIWWISGCPPRAVPLSRSSTRIVQNLRSWHFLISSWRHLEQLLDTSWHFLTILDKSGSSKIFCENFKNIRDDLTYLVTSWRYLSSLVCVSLASWCILSRLDNSGGEKVVTNQEEVCKNHQEDLRICQEAIKKPAKIHRKLLRNIT